MAINITETGLAGLLIVEPRRMSDSRGFFYESFQQEHYVDAGISDCFVQDNLSRSVQGVLRGLHYQVKHPQAQLLTVVRGTIFDVVVDMRPNSETFGKWLGIELSDCSNRQLYMAPGFAHGFCVLSEVADLHYKVSRFYDPKDEAGLLWSDADVGISWPIENPILSPRDAAYPTLREITDDRFPSFSGDSGNL